ncbi:MAG: hypothetical protein JST67_01205, partial [Bacteroidetes bacterium]|nr:hypothetical protein [Bacteroidota bacterium]
TYKFTNLNAGTYSFVVTKPGYGLTKYFGFEFVGGGTTYKNFSLAQIPSFNVSTAQTVLGVDTIIINGTVPHQPFLVNIKIYVSIPSHTSVNENAGNYSTVLGNYFSPSSTSFSNSISTQNLYSLGFTSGSTVYFALYICNMNGSSYQDPITGLLVSTALSSTPVIVSAIVP